MALEMQEAFSQLMAAVKVPKLVPPVGIVLSIVKVPSVAEGALGSETTETLSTAPAGFVPIDVSLFQVKISRKVAGPEQLLMPMDCRVEKGMVIVAVCFVEESWKVPMTTEPVTPFSTKPLPGCAPPAGTT